MTEAKSGNSRPEDRPVQLQFLGKETQGGNSPTLWDAGDEYVIQGFNLGAGLAGQVGTVPEGEAVIRVPKKLMRYLKEAADGASEL
jgi:hypothetical protein